MSGMPGVSEFGLCILRQLLVGKLSRRSVDVSRGLSLDGMEIWEWFSVSAFLVTGVG